MVKLILLVVFFAYTSVFISCTKGVSIEKAGFDKSFQIAKKEFRDKNYREALNDLNTIILNYGGENGIDSAQFLIGRSHYELDEFYSASFEFNRLSESFPESKLIEEAYFNSAECYRELSPRYTLDQKETYNAISKYQLYLDMFPKGKYSDQSNKHIMDMREKLARKTFESGILYMKLDQPRAAKVYFNEIIDKYYDTSFYPSSLENISQAFLSMKDEYNYQLYLSKFHEIKNNIGK